MPASKKSAGLTNRYRDRLASQRAEALGVLAGSWASLEYQDLDVSFAAWVATASALISEKQRAGISLTEAYFGTYLASELGRSLARRREMVDQDAIVGSDRFGRPLLRALVPALLTVKVGIGSGLAFTVALRFGRNRMLRIGAESMAWAPREALHRLLQRSPSVRGWRRVVTGPSSCGACLAAADGSIHSYRERMKSHGACDCVAEPVVAGLRDRYHRPTGEQLFREMTPEQQAALFYGRGGAEKAKLLRDGDVPFSDLISPDPRALGPDGITETSLHALASK